MVPMTLIAFVLKNIPFMRLASNLIVTFSLIVLNRNVLMLAISSYMFYELWISFSDISNTFVTGIFSLSSFISLLLMFIKHVFCAFRRLTI